MKLRRAKKIAKKYGDNWWVEISGNKVYGDGPFAYAWCPPGKWAKYCGEHGVIWRAYLWSLGNGRVVALHNNL